MAYIWYKVRSDFMVNPKNNPKFVRWMSKSLKRVKSPWRKPHGINSKIRVSKKGKLSMPSVGYGAPNDMKYLHPSGFREILVNNVNDLEKINTGKEAARIASAVGGKKRSEILKKAEEMKVKILNP